ncbi:hypothetical protein M3172_03740 [Mesobacillus subterraneus]|uniref:hypothetical protein n=1 Tax=Mesobacillus subterraneus TaxID=285983 RepID=UPI00204227C0|nr:hypothetical protein [Mesobacillus subterraneus]MCM3572289.1 hypothetical protein [Mesobacillus subterraneus]
MIDRNLVQSIVIEVIRALEKEQEAETASSLPKLLIIGDASWISEDTLKKLKQNWEVSYSREPKAKECESADHIFFFNASQDFIVKGALGIADTQDTILLSHLLLVGKKVTISPEEGLAGYLNQNLGQSNRYIKQLKKYVEKLVEFGAEIEAIEEFAKKQPGLSEAYSKTNSSGHSLAGIKSAATLDTSSQRITEHASTSTNSGIEKKKLLTQRDVQDCQATEIIVCKSTIITPSARDAAKELGKSIVVTE